MAKLADAPDLGNCFGGFLRIASNAFGASIHAGLMAIPPGNQGWQKGGRKGLILAQNLTGEPSPVLARCGTATDPATGGRGSVLPDERGEPLKARRPQKPD